VAGLVTLEFVQARPGFSGADADELQACIDDASALCRLEATPLLDDTTDADCPEAVAVVIVQMCRRAVTNPVGNTQETLGDYSRTTGSDSGGVATLYMTARERRIVRAAAGKLSATTLELDGYLPVQPSELLLTSSTGQDTWDAVTAE
jgi:hypothetical protein